MYNDCSTFVPSFCYIYYQGINILGYNRIDSQNYKYTGILFVNFYGDTLLSKIISLNTVLYSACSPTQIASGCTLCSLGFCAICD